MAYIPPLNGGRINATIAGNTAGAGSLVSTGTLTLAGGNNITLSQAGNAITLSAPVISSVSATGILSISSNGATVSIGAPAFSAGISSNSTVSNQLILAAGNNISLAQSTNATGATVSINATGYAGTGFSGTNATATLNSNGLQLSVGAGGGGGGVALYDGAHSISSGTASIQASGAITASITNQTLNLSVPQTSGIVGSGIVNLSNNGTSVTISAPAFSAGISSNSTVSNQLILAAGNNINLSQSTNATGATVSINATNVLTTARASTDAIGLNTAKTNVTWTVNSSGLSLNAAGYAGTGFSGTNASATLNSNGLQLSVGAGGGGGVALYDGAHSISSGTASIQASGGITASITNQTLNLSVAQTSSVVGGGIVNLSTNAGSVTISAPAFSAGVSNLSNDSGSTGMMTNRLVLAGGNNITLSQSTNASGATVSISGGAGGGGGGGVALFDGVHSISSGTASIVPSGALGVTITGQTLSLAVPATSSLAFTGALSVSTAGSTMTLGVPMFSGGVSNFSNDSGTTGTVTNQLILAGGNNITLSQSSGAGGATVTIVGGAGGGGGGGIALANSNTTFSTGTVNFIEGGGAITIASTTGQSFRVSVPGTSSLVGVGGINISTSGSTISISGGGGGQTLSRWEYPEEVFTSVGAPVNGSLSIEHVYAPFNVFAASAKIAASFTVSTFTQNSTASMNYSLFMGIYTLTGSTLSLLASGSANNAFSWGRTNSSTSYINQITGVRQLTVPLAASVVPGEYWAAALINSASTFAPASMSLMGNDRINATGAIGIFGSSTSAGRDALLGQGIFTTTTNALPSSIVLSAAINNTSASYAQRAGFYHVIYNATY